MNRREERARSCSTCGDAQSSSTPEVQPIAPLLIDAAHIATRFGLSRYSTLELLLATMRKDPSLRDWLVGKGLLVNDILGSLVRIELQRTEVSIGEVLGVAHRVASNMAGSQPRPVHVLYAMLSFGAGTVAARLFPLGTDISGLQRELLAMAQFRTQEEPTQEAEREKTPLERYGVDYTVQARNGRFRDITGRETEVLAVVEALAHKGMEGDEVINNPVLLGDAGVGKTAIAKYLALCISRRDSAVSFLWDHRVVYVSLAGLMADTAMRGSLEGRVQAILTECKEGPPTIIFLDELHMVMDLGKTEGSSGLQEILKPILAEGLSCIGATTRDEWRVHIEKNPAFASRWIPVPVEEPNAEAVQIIVERGVHGIALSHLVHFSDQVMTLTLKIAGRYLTTLHAPRREMDIVFPGVAAKVKIAGRISATTDDVLRVAEQLSGMPIRVDEDECDRASRAFEVLSQSVFGQENAVRALADVVQLHKSGLQGQSKPLVVLLLGPTGVGKTYLFQTVAREFWNDRTFRIDMAEYQERHTVSRLIGAPPGYVRSNEEGLLTAHLKRLGRGAGLLDEIEKAHPDVLQLFLGLFGEEGRVTDASGATFAASEWMFCMTSNLGSEIFTGQGSRPIGFVQGDEVHGDSITQRVIAAAKRGFSPELWGRIDQVVVLEPLTAETVAQIATRYLHEQRALCEAEKGFTLVWGDDLVALLVQEGFSSLYGARPMVRAVKRLVTGVLATPVLRGEIVAGDVVTFAVREGVVCWTK